MESPLVGVVRRPGFEDSVDLVKQFPHDGDDDLLGRFTIEFEAVGEILEQWIEDPRGHGRHEESTA